MAAPESATSKRILRGRERELEALELRKQGFTYEQIGKRMGITATGAFYATRRALGRIIDKTSEEALQQRTLQHERLEEMLAALWPKRNIPTYADRIIRILEREAKLYGLDAPERMDISGVGLVVNWDDVAMPSEDGGGADN